MTTIHDDECEQATQWACNCEQRASTSAAIEAWVVECRETVAA